MSSGEGGKQIRQVLDHNVIRREGAAGMVQYREGPTRALTMVGLMAVERCPAAEMKVSTLSPTTTAPPLLGTGMSMLLPAEAAAGAMGRMAQDAGSVQEQLAGTPLPTLHQVAAQARMQVSRRQRS